MMLGMDKIVLVALILLSASIHSIHAIRVTSHWNEQEHPYEFLRTALFQPQQQNTLDEITAQPTSIPTLSPTEYINLPTVSPTLEPTALPTEFGSQAPSLQPTFTPSSSPTELMSMEPTLSPTYSPTEAPSLEPTEFPTPSPTESPSLEPSQIPTESPSLSPSMQPSYSPSYFPSSYPTRTGKEGDDWWYVVLGKIDVVASSKISKSQCAAFLQSYFSAEFSESLKVEVLSVEAQPSSFAEYSLQSFRQVLPQSANGTKSVYSLETWTNSKNYALEVLIILIVF